MTEYLLPAIGILGTLAVTLGGIMIRRLYGAIDILFAKIDKQQKAINVLMLVAMKDDPESTSLFRALTANGESR
jgi:hypothetical protein